MPVQTKAKVPGGRSYCPNGRKRGRRPGQAISTPRILGKLRPGVTLGGLARGTKLTTSHLSRVFRRKATPSLGAAQRISAFLRVSLDELYAALN